MKQYSNRLKRNTRRSHHNTIKTLRYGGSAISMAKYKSKSRASVRGASIDKEAKKKYDNNCYFFTGNPTPTIQQIKNRFRCRRSNEKTTQLYAQDRTEKDQYNYIPRTHLIQHSCLTNYNNYFNKEKVPLTFDTLCDADKGFKDINPDYDVLIDYAYELERRLEVDPLIKEFIKKLILYTNIDRDGLSEIYKGAFVVIQDKGFFYDDIVKDKKNSSKLIICNAKKTIPDTSHDSVYDSPQYRIGTGILYDCSAEGKCDAGKRNTTFDCLIGKSPIPDLYGNTWFQFEYANLLGVWNKLVLHGYSFIKHKISGKNVGPLGTSEYAEYVKPFILSVCGCDDGSAAQCIPLQCVKQQIDLHEYSSNFLSRVNLSLPSYQRIRLKNFIPSRFIDSNYRMSLGGLHDAITGQTIEQLTMIAPYVTHIRSETRYDINIIQEIVFLLFYHATHSNRNYDEIAQTIRNKYFTSRSSSGSRSRSSRSRSSSNRSSSNRSSSNRSSSGSRSSSNRSSSGSRSSSNRSSSGSRSSSNRI